MAFLSSTKTSLFASQPLFFLNFRLYLFASEVYPLTGVSPCHCNQMRVTGHGLSSLIVKFLIFIFIFQAWELFHDITHFLKTTYFSSSISDCTCNQLDQPLYPSTSFQFLFWLLSKVLSQNFQFFSLLGNFTLLGNYIWLFNFLVNPSCTATDKYCHVTTNYYRNQMHYNYKLDNQ